MTDVRTERRTLLVDGEPRVLTAGEIHYFRLHRRDWADRLATLRSTGANAVATYVPWVAHERADGTIDVTGATDDRLDVGAFLDLAADHGLAVILRPGPFVMAEMTGEGVPPRLRLEHPEIVPVGWRDGPGHVHDVDYLAPAFLDEVGRWYAALGEVIAPRMAPRGGPVIAVQLDNEVGMLAWIANGPHLTDHACAELGESLVERYGTDGVARRYPGWDPADVAASVRHPQPAWARALRLDLGRFFRGRFGRYVETLGHLADRSGMGGVPHLVNIHGTSGGSGATFPVGLSQVVQTYADRPQLMAGSDHYLGDLTLRTAADLHLMNAFMAAAAPNQPGSTLEFEAGSGDYGDDLWNDVDPSAVVLKTRLSLAQGHRLLNYYLFAGGLNFPTDPPGSAGTTLFASTGERHGFAAPVDPEGRPGRSFDATAEAIGLTAVVAPFLADADEEHDDVAIGMVLDDYLTEYRVPGDADDADAIGELEYARGGGPRSLLGRVLLTLGYRYGAVDLQRPDAPLPHLVVLGSPVAADRAVQQRLADHVVAGGALLLLGGIPTTELDGTPCTVLGDALGVRVTGEERDRPDWFTSVTVPSGWGHGTERRVGRVQLYDAPDAQVLLAEAISGRAAGLLVRAGAGSAVVIGCDFGADLGFFERALTELGAAPGLVRAHAPGLIATTTRAADGSRLLHVLNVSGALLSSTYELDGEPLLGGAVTLPPRTGAALPIGVRVGDRELTATAEIREVAPDAVVLAPAPDPASPRRAWLDGVEVTVADDGRVPL